jgi:TP901 family phage tail tape measure protein
MAIGAGAAGGAAFGVANLVGRLTGGLREVERARGDLLTLGIENTAAITDAGEAMQLRYAGVTAAAFTRAAYDIKSGISTLSDEGVAAVTGSAVVTAKATRATAEQMTSLFATSYGLFKDQFGDLTDAEFADRFGATLAASVRQFKTDGGAMQQAIESAGAFAANMGMGMEEQLAVLGQMQTSMQAGEAGTALRAFASASSAAQDAFAEMAQEGDNPVRVRVLDENNMLRAMPDILADLTARYGETLDAVEAAEIKDAFGTEEAVKLIQSLYGQEEAVRANASTLTEAAEKGREYTDAMAELADSNFDAQVTILGQSFGILAMGIGKRLVPAIEWIIPKVEEITKRVTAWIDENPRLATGIGAVVIGVGALAAVAVPLLLAASGLSLAFGTLGAGVSVVGAGMALVTGLFGGTAKGAAKGARGVSRLGRAFRLVGRVVALVGKALLMNPIGAAVAVIAGGAYLIWRNWDRLGPWFGRLWGGIKAGISAGWNVIKNLFLNYTALGLVITHWDGIVDAMAGLWRGVRAGVEIGWGLIKSAFLNFTPWGLIYQYWNGTDTWFSRLWLSIRTGVATGWEAVKGALAPYGPAALVEAAWTGLDRWFSGLWDRVKASIPNFDFGEIITFPAPPAWLSRLLNGDARREAAAVAGAYERPAGTAARAQARASGGPFRAGPVLVGERGPELRYEDRAGFIAHHRQLREMATLSDAAVVDPLEPRAVAVGRAGGGTFAPVFNMPVTVNGGSPDTVAAARAVVRAELDRAQRRAAASYRAQMHDR